MAKRRNPRWEELDKAGIDLSTAIQHYEVHNRTEGKSERTVEWYNEVLEMFLQWLRSKKLATSIGDIGEMEVREFILYLQSRPGLWGKMSTHTIANRVRALRAFFSWLHRKGYTDENALKDLREPKTLEQVIEPLTEEEIDRVLSAINPNTALGARNTALVSLMLDTGLRLSEVANLKEQDVHFKDHYIKVLGKGNKERVIAFGNACQRALMHYYHYFRVQPSHPGVDTFFLTLDGYSLTADGIRSLIERISKAAQVKRLHPHLLRHTYATNFLLNGGDIFLLKQNLGHTTLVMVEHYLHIANQRAVVRSQGFSPLDRLNVKDSRRFRHSFSGIEGRIYPNVGRERKNGSRKAS